MLRDFVKTAVVGLTMLSTIEANNQPAPGSSLQSFLINYNFETYPQSAVGQVPVVATIINDYDLLHFNTFLVNTTQPIVTGVPPHTPPACMAVTESQVLLSGILTPGSNPVSAGPGVITAAYQYSPISYFDPYAFYYGCVAPDQNGAASVPVSCNITATGLDSSHKQIISQTFQFKATGAVLQPMNIGYFSQSWSGLKVQTLYITVSNNLTTAALIDNFVASVYGPQNAAVLIDF